MTKIERIPEHIMEQAKDVADRLFRRGHYRDRHVAKDPERIIALALQAVDTAAEKRGKEEAAKIAEALGSTVSHGQPLTEFAQATRIAAAIRGS